MSFVSDIPYSRPSCLARRNARPFRWAHFSILCNTYVVSYMSCKQVLALLGPKTYAGKRTAAVGNHHCHKECIDIHLLKKDAHDTVANLHLGLVSCTDDARSEWVTYPYSTAHSILCWLHFEFAEWLSENLADELTIPAKRGYNWTVEELNSLLVNNLVASDSTGGQIRTLGAIQWECEMYRGRCKARCYPFELDGHYCRGKNPKVKVCLYYMVFTMLNHIYLQDCV
jgi:hypothetical protein